MREIVLGSAVVFGVVGSVMAEPPTTSPQDRVVIVGKQVSDELLSNLQRNLKDAMASGGPVHAISFCSERAGAISEETAAKFESGVRVTRVSDRPRNPVNALDHLDQGALSYFLQVAREGGKLPPHYTSFDESRDEYRYYRPITIAPLCLTCHGDRAQMGGEVREAIAARYPVDRAYGYHEGDIRGLMRVTVSRAVIPRE